MRVSACILLLITSGALATAFASGAAGPQGVNPPQEPDLTALAAAMDAIARGDADVSVALTPFVNIPAPADVPKSGDLRFPGFRDARGYVLRELEVRVREYGIDGAPVVMAHVEPEPCLDLEPLSVLLEATEFFRVPPSPHAPPGTPGVHGYTIQYPSGGSLSISARADLPDCVIGISTRPPAPAGRTRTPTTRSGERTQN